VEVVAVVGAAEGAEARPAAAEVVVGAAEVEAGEVRH
jgi:hypothetical protein